MNNPPDFIPQFDGQFEDGLSVPDSLCTAAHALPSEKIGEEVCVGKRATVYRLVSDVTDNL